IGYASRSLGTGVDGRKLHYTARASEENVAIEGSGGPRRTLTEWEEDEYGNVVAERQWGEVVGPDKRFGQDEAIFLRTYALDKNRWVLDRLATEELQDGAGRRVRFRRIYYDGEPFVGLPLGQV